MRGILRFVNLGCVYTEVKVFDFHHFVSVALFFKKDVEQLKKSHTLSVTEIKSRGTKPGSLKNVKKYVVKTKGRNTLWRKEGKCVEKTRKYQKKMVSTEEKSTRSWTW